VGKKKKKKKKDLREGKKKIINKKIKEENVNTCVDTKQKQKKNKIKRNN
jgi:hypothetical protein